MSNHIIVPSHKTSSQPIDYEDDNVNVNRLSLILEVEDEKNDLSPTDDIKRIDSINDAHKDQLEFHRIGQHNYLCVIASPRYRKTKAIYQKEDEYWFMIPICKYLIP